MSERVTNLALHNAMEYLADTLGVAYIPEGQAHKLTPRPGDLTLESHAVRNGRYYFGIYRYTTKEQDFAPVGARILKVHRPYGLQSYSKREMHDHVRFAIEAIRAHRGILARAEEMGER
jgi:penicillin V acylase-like amidase (Ntn superfamily)